MRYLRGNPAPKFLLFCTRGTKFRQFVQFKQPTLRNWHFDEVWPEKVVPRVHQGFVTPNGHILIQTPRRRVFLLCGHKVQSHTKFQVASKPRRRVWQLCAIFTTYSNFPETLSNDRISHRVNFGAIGSWFPRFGYCSIRCETFRLLAALDVIFTFPGCACWQKIVYFVVFWDKSHTFCQCTYRWVPKRPH